MKLSEVFKNEKIKYYLMYEIKDVNNLNMHMYNI